MARLIPRRTKVKTEFFKGLTIMDGVIGIVFMLLLALVLISDFSVKLRLILSACVIMVAIVMFLQIAPETRTYQAIGDLFKYIFGVKKFTKQKHATRKSVNALMPYVGILEQNYDEKHKVGIIDYKEYFGVAIEIKSIEFYMLSLARQDAYIAAFDNALKSLSSEQSAAIFKDQWFLTAISCVNVKRKMRFCKTLQTV